jgi:hypothetical protein
MVYLLDCTTGRRLTGMGRERLFFGRLRLTGNVFRRKHVPLREDWNIAALNMMNRAALFAFAFAVVSITARAQFKETPPAPYTPTVARQKIRALIANVEPGKRQPAVDTLSGLLVWYRDTLDDELIAAWKRDGRENLPALIMPLADARLASAIVEFSWHERRPETFNLTYAPMLGDLMERYHASADPFLRDLLGPAAAGGPMPDLTQPEAAAVCRILLDMPDTADWKKTALQILPHYRPIAQDLLLQDLRGNDQEKIYRAQFWMSELKMNAPGVTSDPPNRRKLMLPPPPAPTVTQPSSGLMAQRPHIVGPPYTGPKSGTMKCSGNPVPPNAEYVFPGMPLGNIQLDLDGKPWDARLVPGLGQTQDLILTNRSPGPQKKCTVRWSIVP